MGVLASCASEASREILIHIYHQDDGLLENYESFDPYGNWLFSALIDLKTQALGILRRFDISELYSDIVKSLQTCELDLLHRYLEVAGEKKIPEAFNILASFPLERFEDLAGFILQTMYMIDPKRTIDWAREAVRMTSSLGLMSSSCDFLESHGVDPKQIEGFTARLLDFFSEQSNRCYPWMYWLIRRYRIEEAGPWIVHDLPLLFGPDADILNMPIYEMFETLAFLEYLEGHQQLVRLLPDSPPHFRKAILEYLGQYRLRTALPEFQRYRTDPELSIRELCEQLLGQVE
jgi:hypothetical protein